MKKVLNVIIQLPQVIIGLVVLGWLKLFNRKNFIKKGRVSSTDNPVENTTYFYKSKKQYDLKGVTFGPKVFVFYDKDYVDKKPELEYKVLNVVAHEWGHSVQSLKYSWLYPLFGIGSLMLTSMSNYWAEKYFLEKEADKIRDKYSNTIFVEYD